MSQKDELLSTEKSQQSKRNLTKIQLTCLALIENQIEMIPRRTIFILSWKSQTVSSKVPSFQKNRKLTGAE